MARTLTIDAEVYEVVAEAPGGTSMLLINRSKQCRNRIEELEQLLAAERARLATVEHASREQGCPAAVD